MLPGENPNRPRGSEVALTIAAGNAAQEIERQGSAVTGSEFDLVVAGTGAAGLAAALTAAGRGLSVCLLEKGRQIGGGTATSYGTLWVPDNALAREAGLPDSFAQGLAYAQHSAGGAGLAASLETYVREAPRALDCLRSHGVAFQLAMGLPEAFHPAAPGSWPDGRRMVEPAPIGRAALGPWADALRPAYYMPPGVSWGDVARWGGFANRRNWDQQELARRERDGLLGAGQALVAQLLVACLKLGVTLRLGQGVTRLLVEDGRVCGVYTGDDAPALRARSGVVLATGGYEGNADLVRRFEGLPDWLNAFSPTNEGDGMIIATELGAAVYRLPVNHGLLVGCAIPQRGDEFFSIGLHGMPYPGAIAVNRRGRRFCDESRFQEVVHAFHHFDSVEHRLTNLPAWMVFDEHYRQHYSIAGAPPGDPAPPWVTRAGSLADLAHGIGVDAEGLRQTVSTFNGFVAAGEDREFGRGRSAFSRSTAGDAQASNAQLGALDTPPYYAIRLRVGGIVSAGVLVNEHGGVVHVRGHAIPGLYACGNTAAPTDTGVGYQGGASIGSGMIFGFLAAEHAARRGG